GRGEVEARGGAEAGRPGTPKGAREGRRVCIRERRHPTKEGGGGRQGSTRQPGWKVPQLGGGGQAPRRSRLPGRRLAAAAPRYRPRPRPAEARRSPTRSIRSQVK